MRSRHEPGGWLDGKKGARVATAALSAAGIDAIIDRDPEWKPKRHIAESVVGGLGISYLANGSPEVGPDPRTWRVSTFKASRCP